MESPSSPAFQMNEWLAEPDPEFSGYEPSSRLESLKLNDGTTSFNFGIKMENGQQSSSEQLPENIFSPPHLSPDSAGADSSSGSDQIAHHSLWDGALLGLPGEDVMSLNLPETSYLETGIPTPGTLPQTTRVPMAGLLDGSIPSLEPDLALTAPGIVVQQLPPPAIGPARVLLEQPSSDSSRYQGGNHPAHHDMAVSESVSQTRPSAMGRTVENSRQSWTSYEYRFPPESSIMRPSSVPTLQTQTLHNFTARENDPLTGSTTALSSGSGSGSGYSSMSGRVRDSTRLSMIFGTDVAGHGRTRSISKMPLSELYALMGLAHDHDEAKRRETKIMEVLRSEGFDVGRKTWIRDTPEPKRRDIIQKLMAESREWGYTPGVLEIIVRRGTYARMQSRLRQNRRQARRNSSMGQSL